VIGEQEGVMRHKSDVGLGRTLRDFVQGAPDKRAFICLGEDNIETETLNYGELDRRARLLAERLREWGRPDDRALLVFPTCLSFVVAFFACTYTGMVAVPMVAPRSRRQRGAAVSIALDCQPRFVLTLSSHVQMVREQLSDVGELAEIRVIAVDELVSGTASNFTPVDESRESLAFLQYTSGSTSAPKGVMVSQRNLMANLEMMATALGNDQNATYVGWAPLFHDMGLISNLLEPFYVGSLCVLMPPAIFAQRPWLWLKAISDYQARVSGGPNFAYDLCIERSDVILRRDFDLAGWKIAFCSGEPVRAATIENFSRIFATRGFRRDAFLPAYGMAEATLLVSAGPPLRPPVVHVLSKTELAQGRAQAAIDAADRLPAVGCGRTLVGEEIRIVDPASGLPRRDGEVGEVWVSGPHIPTGYWGKPLASEETFRATLAGSTSPHFLRTGDLGFVIDGQLFIAGRIKDVIIVRGRNFYPQDIERIAEAAHPGLRTAASAAFAVMRSAGQEIVLVQEVERTCRHSIDHWQTIAAIRQAVLDECELTLNNILLIQPGTIPKTSSGKIKRAETRDRYLNGTLELIGGGTAREAQKIGA
jgi:acyl-CoA synthetase (AMP-forming)/AMP-acid ligase II